MEMVLCDFIGLNGAPSSRIYRPPYLHAPVKREQQRERSAAAAERGDHPEADPAELDRRGWEFRIRDEEKRREGAPRYATTTSVRCNSNVS